MPELKFIADNSIEHSAKINKLLKEVLPEEEKEEERRRRVIEEKGYYDISGYS